MHSEDGLREAFLRELTALEHFRISYLGLRPGTPLHGEDPDIQRLIEALALFSARTRLGGERSLNASLERLFLQQFPYLLTPLPAMGMVQADATSHLADATALPRGESMEASEPEPSQLGVRKREPPRMRLLTMRRMRVMPLRLARLGTFRGEAHRTVLVLFFEAASERIDELEDIHLYVDHSEFSASLGVFHALKTHLEEAHIVYDESAPERVEGARCEVTFGAPALQADEVQLFDHPLERLRTFFHFPEQELFFSIRVPPHHGRPFRRFAIKLALRPSFPRELTLSVNALRLNVTPVINLHKAFANPADYDATSDRIPIRPAEGDQQLRLLEVLGAYRLDDKQGLVPLPRAALMDEPDAYDVDYEGTADKRRASLRLTDTRAFTKPYRVVVDAFWDQPGLSIDPYHARVSCTHRAVPGIQFALRGRLRVAADSQLPQNAWLLLLGLRNRPLLQTRSELQFLLECVGVLESPVFRPLVAAMRDLTLSALPSRTGRGGYKYLYRIELARIGEAAIPALDLLGARLFELLAAWSTEQVGAAGARGARPGCAPVVRRTAEPFEPTYRGSRMTVLPWSQIIETVSAAKTRCRAPRLVRTQSVGAVLQMAVGADLRAPAAPDSFIRDLLGRPQSAVDGGEDDAIGDEALAEALADGLRGLREQLAPARDPRARFSADPSGLRPDEADRVLFPLAIYFDQLIAARSGTDITQVSSFDQPTLVQDTLFHIDNGGERFYLTLDEALNERDPPALLLEVFYYCLKDGFLGRYEAHDPGRAAYLERLAQRLAPAPVLRLSLAEPRRPRSERAPFPLRYYLRALAGMAAAFTLLFAAGEVETWLVESRLHAEAPARDAIGPLDQVRPLRDVVRTLEACREAATDGD